MKWTNEQALAIEKEGTNLIISAGAGSGKTAVLSERVISKLKRGIDIRNILILTFTNEAAGEMKERIRKKMQENNINEQLAYIDAAYITTFDAYALSIVKKYHYLFNVDNNIAIIDSSIINLEKKRIIDHITLDLYNQKEPNYLKLVKDFTNRDDEDLLKAILDISNSLDLRYDKEEYLKSYIDKYYSNDYIDKLFCEYFEYLKNLVDLIENDFYMLEDSLSEKNYEKFYEELKDIFKPKTYEDLHRKKIKLPRFQNLDEEAKEIKEHLKELITMYNDLTLYSEKELKEQLISTKPYILAIINIILKLDKEIHAYKKEKNAFEFVDISKMAIKLVKENKSIREELKANYQEIMIDEYQDTNDLQEMFIQEIANNNVYMVGDIKQSIYRFRNANPDIFREKYNSYKLGLNGQKIDLLENFRSRKEVLEAINLIFNLIMIPSLGGVDYQDNHAMIYGNKIYDGIGNNNEFNDLEILKYLPENSNFSNTEIEAFTIAQDIKNKVENNYQVFDFKLNKVRSATYSDFCIILDRGTQMARYKKIFEYFNIPMEVYKDSNLVLQEDILILRNIFRLVLAIKKQEYNTNMRYYFVSIARSYIGNITDEEIFKMLEENTLYNSEIYKVAQSLANQLDELTPNMLLLKIITKYNFYEKLILVGNVEEALVRLDYLLSLANSMESLGFTINDFVEYLNSMIDNNTEIRYKENKKGSNCVKIMNIHKSKGLEFPICYFAGFKEKFNLRDLQARFSYDTNYGIITPFYQEGIGQLFTKVLVKNKYIEEEIAEKIRLFYVALTRAKEKIIIVLPEFKKENKVNNKIAYLDGIKFRSFYDFLNTISLNLKNYVKTINLNELNITKDYENILRKKVNKIANKEILEIKEITIQANLLEQNHASKNINSILTSDDIKTLEYGTKIHEMLENTDFKSVSNPNKYVKHLLDTFDFTNAIIYQELEFIFAKDNNEYHGIIDLMLEYEEEIKIIDYKLKNIDDEAYIKQLTIYYEYISSVSNKKISLYLYSILDNKVKEIITS